MDYRVKLVVWHLQVELTWNGVEVPQIAPLGPLLCSINPYPISQIRSKLSLELMSTKPCSQTDHQHHPVCVDPFLNHNSRQKVFYLISSLVNGELADEAPDDAEAFRVVLPGEVPCRTHLKE